MEQCASEELDTELCTSKLQYSITAAQSNSSCQRKKNSHEPSCCKDAIPSAGSLKDKHVLHCSSGPIDFLQFCLQEHTHCSLFGLAGMLGQDDHAGGRDSKRYHRTAELRQKREEAQPGSFPHPRTRSALGKSRGAQVRVSS